MADINSGKCYVRVSDVAMGSEAQRQLPGLQIGAFLLTLNGRAVGGMHVSAVVALLATRPLALQFTFDAKDVDRAAVEQRQRGSHFPIDVTFSEPIGTPLGLTFLECHQFGCSSVLFAVGCVRSEFTDVGHTLPAHSTRRLTGRARGSGTRASSGAQATWCWILSRTRRCTGTRTCRRG